MRLIDADALMEGITTWQKDLEKEYGWHDAYVQCLDGVISSIESASTVNPWHRVEEPPKENGRYLVYMFTSDWRWEFKFASYLHDRWIGTGGGDVRYWMPIEPPQEVQE